MGGLPTDDKLKKGTINAFRKISFCNFDVSKRNKKIGDTGKD
ncbi:hypothetical protein CPter91_3631 [Collimonas pratensis]|uniref:Uncharacterized protein n=1 Tax=Collimonas pratensis TaxID=279113 RepID=A0A127Q8L0_9BURK|nr:hypothetical protein CPter91_3631 [Collimonas pratensis]